MGSNTPAVPCCELRGPEALVDIAGRLINELRTRGWNGDDELVTELEHYATRSSSDLISLPVALDELGEALDQSAGSESYIDATDGALWPAQLFDVGQGPDDFDEGSDPVVCRGWTRIGVRVRGDAALHRNDRRTGSRRAPHRCDRRLRRV